MECSSEDRQGPCPHETCVLEDCSLLNLFMAFLNAMVRFGRSFRIFWPTVLTAGPLVVCMYTSRDGKMLL